MTRTITIDIPDSFSVTIGGESMTFNADDVAEKSFHVMLWHGWRKLNDSFASQKSAVLKAPDGVWMDSDAATTRKKLYDAVLDGTIANQSRGSGVPGLSDIDTRVAKLALGKWKDHVGESAYKSDWKEKTTVERYRAVIAWAAENADYDSKVRTIAQRQADDDAMLADLEI